MSGIQKYNRQPQGFGRRAQVFHKHALRSRGAWSPSPAMHPMLFGGARAPRRPPAPGRPLRSCSPRSPTTTCAQATIARSAASFGCQPSSAASIDCRRPFSRRPRLPAAARCRLQLPSPVPLPASATSARPVAGVRFTATKDGYGNQPRPAVDYAGRRPSRPVVTNDGYGNRNLP